MNLSNRLTFVVMTALLAGCASGPAANLATQPAPAAAPVAAAPAAPAAVVAAAKAPVPTVRIVALPDGPLEGTVEAEAPPLMAVTAYEAADRSDAKGIAMATTTYTDPVYLTPRVFPILLPGSPAPLPAFTPRQIDMSKLPTDAVAELGRLSRLREAKKAKLSWLFGNTFLKIEAAEARNRLAAGTAIYLGPDGSRWHRDKTFKEIKDVGLLDAMLPELRQEALDDSARAVRAANINDRMTLLPSFTGTYDLVRLIMMELVMDSYTYGGQSVRPGVIGAANLYMQNSVRLRAATWWEDHPGADVGELRAALNRSLIEELQGIGRNLSSYAASPGHYNVTQAIPGLRDPRPAVGSDTTARDADIRYNRQLLQHLTQATPLALSTSLYP